MSSGSVRDLHYFDNSKADPTEVDQADQSSVLDQMSAFGLERTLRVILAPASISWMAETHPGQMSALINTGRSDCRILPKMNVRYRPEADCNKPAEKHV